MGVKGGDSPGGCGHVATDARQERERAVKNGGLGGAADQGAAEAPTPGRPPARPDLKGLGRDVRGPCRRYLGINQGEDGHQGEHPGRAPGSDVRAPGATVERRQMGGAKLTYRRWRWWWSAAARSRLLLRPCPRGSGVRPACPMNSDVTRRTCSPESDHSARVRAVTFAVRWGSKRFPHTPGELRKDSIEVISIE